jgi:multiple sugar transport system ATP-binding protein
MAHLLVKGGLGTGADGVARDLELADGELFALVGPSAWTRPLVRAIAGLEYTPFDVHVGEREVRNRPPEERGLGFVFPGGALFPHLSVLDNLCFSLVGRGTPRYQVEERLSDVTRLAGLEGILSRRPGNLSPVERLRVSIARSLMRQPQVMLLDEPLASADASLRAALREELVRLLTRAHVTALYSTPDPADAMTTAHRAALHLEGSVRQVGTPYELYANPADRFVAASVGSPPMNVCTLQVADGVLGFGGASLVVPAQQAIVFGVRPEDLRFGEEQAPSLQLRGTVDRVELDGAFARVAVLVSGARLWVHCATRMLPSRGGDATLSLDLQAVHLFSADALGTRIQWEPQFESVRAPETPASAQAIPLTEPAPAVVLPGPERAIAPEAPPGPVSEPVNSPPPGFAAAPAFSLGEPVSPAKTEVTEVTVTEVTEIVPPPAVVEPPAALERASVAPQVEPDARRSRRPRFGKKRRSASR